MAASKESLPSLTKTISSIISPSNRIKSCFLFVEGTNFDKISMMKLGFSRFLKILKFFIIFRYITNRIVFFKLKGKEFTNAVESIFFSEWVLDSI